MRLGRVALLLLSAFILTLASATIQRNDQEVAAYGNMGTIDDMVKPRLTGGWPAPFIADSPNTSVLYKIGIEDDIRPGPFAANVAFWYLVLLGLGALVRKGRGA